MNIDTNNNYLLNYDWPGNIRELRNLIERIAILSLIPLIKFQIL